MSNNQIGFLISWVFLFLFSLFISLLWAMSPLGVGFNLDANATELQLNIGQMIYTASYFLGIPLLIILQIVAGIIGFNGNVKKAFKISVLSIMAFISMAAAAVIMLT